MNARRERRFPMMMVKRIVALILVVLLLCAIAWVTMEVASYVNTASLT